jgi:myo-inositol 2-dehydrogenase / D-chiro-inositol 1-dehydrogenase
MTGTGPLAVGVVGTGWIGEEHLADLAARPGVRIVAVADVDGDRAAGYAAHYDARAYPGHAELLGNEELDALWICTPPQHHREPALAAIDRGVPIYLEKPIARDVADARVIAAAVERAGTVCAVGYQWHSLDLVETVREALAGQTVGCVIGQSIGPTASRPWFLRQDEGGGNILERGSHQIDLTRALAGEITSVRAVAGDVRFGHPGAEQRDIDDALTLILHLASGGIATIVVAWTPDGIPGTYSLDVVATGGVLHLTLDPHFRLSGTSRGETVEAVAAAPAFAQSNGRFIEAVRSKDSARVACTPADAVRTLAVALAAEEALATGQNVPVT